MAKKPELKMRLIETQDAIVRVHKIVTGILEDLENDEVVLEQSPATEPMTGTDL